MDHFKIPEPGEGGDPKRKKVGLVLGSGSSRGWAHIGVIEALLEENIPIDLIAGCSIGSYVGAIYASGGLASLKEFVLEMDGQKVFSYFDVVFPRSGLLDGRKKLREFLSRHTTARDFSDLKIPLLMVATALETGDKVVLKSGDLFTALRATMSIPGLFEPVKVESRWLVDGGIVDPVPVGVARAMGADVVIAVDLNSGLVSKRMQRRIIERSIGEKNARAYQSEWAKKFSEFYETAGIAVKRKIYEMLDIEKGAPDIMETVLSAINIMQERITRINLAVDPPDVLVRPRLGETKMLDFDNVAGVIEEGRSALEEQLSDIRMHMIR